MKIDLMRMSTLFSGLSNQQMGELALLVTLRELHRDELLFLENDPATGIYIVASGQLKLYRTSLEGREAVLHILGQGEQFGEVAALEGAAFPVSAVALEDSSVLYVPRKAILDFIKKDPAFALNMLAGMCKKLRQFSSRLAGFTLQDIEQRLAAYLLDVLDKTDVVLYAPSSHNPIIYLNTSKTSLAGLLGTARETLSRTLKQLSNKGIIAVDGKKIEITDLASLSHIAGAV